MVDRLCVDGCVMLLHVVPIFSRGACLFRCVNTLSVHAMGNAQLMPSLGSIMATQGDSLRSVVLSVTFEPGIQLDGAFLVSPFPSWHGVNVPCTLNGCSDRHPTELSS